MAKRDPLQAQLEAIGGWRADPAAPDAVAALRHALQSKSPFLAAKAATIAGEGEVGALTADLVAAFERWMDPPIGDKGCVVKTAAAEALYRIGGDTGPCERVFRRGVRHVQREPVYGGTVDTAAELRGHCAMGLVRMNHPEALLIATDLLTDPESAARAAGARAIAYRGGEDGLAVLRLKLAVGEPHPEVLTELLLATLQLSPERSLPDVAARLDAADAEAQEAAALALGQSRLPGALEALKAWHERTLDRDLRRTALTAMAMLRLDRSIDHLLALVADADAATAADALHALALHRFDPAVRRRTEAAVARRGDAALRAALREAFGET